MIYVTLGTHEQPFPRALEIVASAAETDALVVQHGHTDPIDLGPGVTWCAFVPYAESGRLMHESSAVIAHAGVGSLMSAIAAGHVPVAVPRLRRYGEHVDDHQLQIAERLSSEGKVVICRTAREFPSALASSRRSTHPAARQTALIEEIARVVAEFAA